MEALAIGLPLFLSNIPVYKEVYQDHAFYFNNDEIASFLHSQNEYHQLTEEVKKSRQKSGKEYAYETANSSQYIRKLLEIY
jgi:glycosyltransferase involved in cell wall biosynthesis